MLTKYYATKECVKFVKNILKTTCSRIFDQTENFIEKNDPNVALASCRSLKSDFFDKPELSTKKTFKIVEVNHGYKLFENFRIPLSMYFIDLYDILNTVISSPQLFDFMSRPRKSTPGIIRSIYDGSFADNFSYSSSGNLKLYVSLYADEINICCAIGK